MLNSKYPAKLLIPVKLPSSLRQRSIETITFQARVASSVPVIHVFDRNNRPESSKHEPGRDEDQGDRQQYNKPGTLDERIEQIQNEPE